MNRTPSQPDIAPARPRRGPPTGIFHALAELAGAVSELGEKRRSSAPPQVEEEEPTPPPDAAEED